MPAQLCLTLCNPMDCSPPGSSVHGIFPGKNIGVGCHFLLQGIFLTQGSNLHLLHLLHWQLDSLPLEPPGKPILSTYIYFSIINKLLSKRKENLPSFMTSLKSYFLLESFITVLSGRYFPYLSVCRRYLKHTENMQNCVCAFVTLATSLLEL